MLGDMQPPPQSVSLSRVTYNELTAKKSQNSKISHNSSLKADGRDHFIGICGSHVGGVQDVVLDLGVRGFGQISHKLRVCAGHRCDAAVSLWTDSAS